MKKIISVILLLMAMSAGASGRGKNDGRVRNFSDRQGWQVQAQGGVSLSMNDDYTLKGGLPIVIPLL